MEGVANVVIIGGGVAGCSAAYYLIKSGVRNVILIESGIPGDGNMNPIHAPTNGSYRLDDFNGEIGDTFQYAQRSGSAVLPSPAQNIKMMVNLYPSSSKDFCSHHGKEGARRYLALAAEGIQFEKDLSQLTMKSEDLYRSYGSLYVAEHQDVHELESEYSLLVELNCQGIEWWNEEKVQKYSGGETAEFGAGIYFPYDGVINSGQYCKDLLSYISLHYPNSLQIIHDTVTSIDSTSNTSHAIIHTQSSQQYLGQYVVIATGGLFVDPSIGGILRPCWSYLVGIQDIRPSSRQTISPEVNESELTEEIIPPSSLFNSSTTLSSHPLRTPNSINLFTWGFTHDWCMTNGYLRLSGADHFSSLKPPRMEERCHELASWAYKKYPYLQPNTSSSNISSSSSSSNSETNSLPTLSSPTTSNNNNDVPYLRQYGVYSETPDSAPLVGTPHDKSRVCYLLGCNAWGQASLSYAASLIPGILGYDNLTLKQREYLSVLTIRRYALLPCVREGN